MVFFAKNEHYCINCVIKINNKGAILLAPFLIQKNYKIHLKKILKHEKRHT